jgi:TRAP-type C4-dicarboxylate transport system permease small subunit
MTPHNSLPPTRYGEVHLRPGSGVMSLERLTGRLSDVLCFIAGIALLWMMVQITIDTIMRYIFNNPLHGTVEILSAYHMMIVVFLPLGYVTQRDAHITVTLFTNRLSPSALDALERVVNAINLAVLIPIIWMTGREAIFRTVERETWDAGNLLVSIWPSRWAPPIGCAAMALYLVVKIFDPRRGIGA